MPPFNTYFPSIEDAGAEQQAFYRWFVRELREGRSPDVQGNLSYLFVLIYEVIGDFTRTRDYGALAHWFGLLRAGYAGGSKIGSYLDSWQGDAALLAQNCEEAWAFKRRQRLDMDLVVNVRKRCSVSSLAAQDLHALLLSDDGLTDYGRQHLDALDEEANRLLAAFQASNGMSLLDAFFERWAWRELADLELDQIADDCEYLVSAQRLKNAYRKKPRHEKIERALFSGVMLPWVTTQGSPTDVGGGMTMSFTTRLRAMNPTVPFVRLSPAIELAAIAQCKRLLREAENSVREREGLPRIGEGWITEAALFTLLREAFVGMTVVQHARPEWLVPQHLDVYLPEYGIGVEFQGAQHLGPLDYFGGDEAFRQQKKRDARKKHLCAKSNCSLVEVFQGYDQETVVAEIRMLVRQAMAWRAGAGSARDPNCAR